MRSDYPTVFTWENQPKNTCAGPVQDAGQVDIVGGLQVVMSTDKG
jgi:hypothetical protein